MAAALSFTLSSFANAATIQTNVDFSNNSGSGYVYNDIFNNGSNISLTVSSAQGSMTSAIFGLGVNSGFADDGALDNYWTGANPETILFTFSEAVVFDTINLGLYESCCENPSKISIDGGAFFNLDDDSSTTFNGQGTAFLLSTPTRSGLSNATTFRVDNIDVSAVPVPAAVWLFGSALFGLFGVARRRSANAA
jgi:hypothetical protein